MAFLAAINSVRNLCAWLNLADYQEAKDKATKRIIMRLARGNVSFQNGWMLDDTAVTKLSSRGDEAVKRLNKLASKR